MLWLFVNNIKKIEGLGELTSLKVLALEDNQICDDADLIYLGETLKKLEYLNICRNPLQSTREQVKAAIPQLKEFYV